MKEAAQTTREINLFCYNILIAHGRSQEYIRLLLDDARDPNLLWG